MTSIDDICLTQISQRNKLGADNGRGQEMIIGKLIGITCVLMRVQVKKHLSTLQATEMRLLQSVKRCTALYRLYNVDIGDKLNILVTKIVPQTTKIDHLYRIPESRCLMKFGNAI